MLQTGLRYYVFLHSNEILSTLMELPLGYFIKMKRIAKKKYKEYSNIF